MTTIVEPVPEVTTSRPVARRALRVGLFGSALNTGNRGVNALGMSTLGGLAQQPGVDLDATIFDYDRTGRVRETTVPLPDRGSVNVRLVGCYHSRGYHRTNNLAQMYAAARLGLARAHPMLRRLAELDAVLDISGGDSFSDIYGGKRFTSIVLPKQIAIRLGVPLILTPQTYGPFRDDRARRVAADICRGATQVWARDLHSHEIAKGLLGDAFDPRRHRSGVDVAFGLPVRKPADAKLADAVEAFKASADVLVGLNVSGLLYEKPGADVGHYGFLDSYRDTIHDLLARLLATPGAKVLLVPHVSSTTASTFDCDTYACKLLVERLAPAERERVMTLPSSLDATELKWAIGRCDWFCGTRMHACIGAISQGTPATAVAYSDKTLGVFETAGVGDSVVDPRRVRRAELVERVMAGLDRRAQTAAALRERLPVIRRTVNEQFAAIVRAVS